MRAVVIGAGIAGLGAALGLAHAGHEVVVLERQDRVQELGAGIVLWPNALRALDVLGVRDRVQAVAELGGLGGFRRPDGQWLTRVDGARFAARYGQVAAIHRGELVELLHRAAVDAGVVVHCGRQVTAVEPDLVSGCGGVRVVTGEQEWPADLVVAADGLRSATRQSCFPGAVSPRPTGLTAWRWVVDWDAAGLSGDPAASVTVGAGMEFGIIPLPGRRVYCYASSACRKDGSTPAPQAYRSWHDPIPALVEAGTGSGMLCHELFDLPPMPTFVRRDLGLALVGDAAHAMTPHLGQGAAQGLEDAAHLSLLARRSPVTTHAAGATTATTVARLLTDYDRARVSRAHAVQKSSRQAMDGLVTTNPLTVAVRDAAIRALPRGLVTWGLARSTHDSLGR